MDEHQQQQDKIMEDLDPDFINEILGSSELSDHLINELMDELSSGQNPTPSTNNINNHHHATANIMTPSNNVIHHTSDLNYAPATNNPMMMPMMIPTNNNSSQFNNINQTPMDITGLDATTSGGFLMYPNNNPTDYIPVMPPSNIQQQQQQQQQGRRVRKNLKDILSGGETTNTNTILINQSSNFIDSHHRAMMMNAPPPPQPPPSVYPMLQPQQVHVLPQIVTDIAANNNNNNSNNDNKIYHLNPSSNIQIVIENPPVGIQPTAVIVNPVPVSGNNIMPSSSSSSSPVRKVPSSSSITSQPSLSLSSPPEQQIKPGKTTKLGTTMKKSTKSSGRANSAAVAAGLVKLEADELKMLTTTTAFSSGDEENKVPMMVGKKGKPHKRTSHNAIERKYRSSINDKISELKMRVAGPNVKLQKSGILRKALEYINNMEDTNRRLGDENTMLRSALATISTNVNNPAVIENVLRNVMASTAAAAASASIRTAKSSSSSSSSSTSSSPPMSPNETTTTLIGGTVGGGVRSAHGGFLPNTPSPSSSSSSSETMFSLMGGASNDSSNDSSSSSSSSSSPVSSPLPPPPSKKYQKKPAASATSRVVLCAVLLSVLVLNPFSWLSQIDNNNNPFKLDSASSGFVHGSGRVLNSLDDIADTTINNNSTSIHSDTTNITYAYIRLARVALTWLLNSLVVLVCLAFVYVSGEARVDASECELRELVWSRYERANKEWSSPTSRNYEQAYAQLRMGLADLGQSCPRSTFSLVLGIMWQSIRLVLGRVLFANRRSYLRRVASAAARWTRRDDADSTRLATLRRLTSLLYYEMHKFAYLNMRHDQQEFVPRTAVRTTTTTTHPIAAQLSSTLTGENTSSMSGGGSSAKLVVSDRPYVTTYSYLTGVYYLLALYNQIETTTMSNDDDVSSSKSLRDQYELCEFYLSMCVFAKCVLPSFLSTRVARFLVRQKLIPQLEKSDSTESRVKKLLGKSLFVNFAINFDRLSVSSAREGKTSSLLAYKRRLFASSFLYDSDEKQFNNNNNNNSGNTVTTMTGGVAVEYLAAKFKDYVLMKMTKHVIDQSAAVIETSELAKRAAANNNNSSSSSTHRRRGRGRDVVGECDRELNDVDRARFEALKTVYTQDLDYVLSSRHRNDVDEIRLEQDTHRVLVEFLEMLNHWKLGNLDDIHVNKLHQHQQQTKRRTSLFVDAVVNVMSACESIKASSPRASLEFMKRAVEAIDEFEIKSSPTNASLVENFELLIYDWVLSAQTHLWSHHKLYELDLFNKSLSRFKSLIVNYPQLTYKAKMYETVLMFSSNRNPISLIQPSSSQFVYSKCNQDAFYSMNSILKQFQLIQL